MTEPLALPMTALEYFALLVRSDEGLPLLEAASCLAHIEHPTLDVQDVVQQVDPWLARLQRRVQARMGALERVQALNRFLYGELGFAGNLNDYYAPGNSHLQHVLHTRRGIPISLAVLWLELAQGIGLHAHGIAFPGHYLVGVRVPGGQVVIDPLSGESLSESQLHERLALAAEAPTAPPPGDAALAFYLQPARPRDTLGRMLRNLKEIYRSQHDHARLLAVQQYLVVLYPHDWNERRERALAYAACGQPREAREDMQAYLDHRPHAADEPRWRAWLQQWGKAG